MPLCNGEHGQGNTKNSGVEMDNFEPMKDDWHSPDNKVNQKTVDLSLPADMSVSETNI